MSKIQIQLERGIDTETFVPYVEARVKMSLEYITDLNAQMGEEEAAEIIASEIKKVILHGAI